MYVMTPEISDSGHIRLTWDQEAPFSHLLELIGPYFMVEFLPNLTSVKNKIKIVSCLSSLRVQSWDLPPLCHPAVAVREKMMYRQWLRHEPMGEIAAP